MLHLKLITIIPLPFTSFGWRRGAVVGGGASTMEYLQPYSPIVLHTSYKQHFRPPSILLYSQGLTTPCRRGTTLCQACLTTRRNTTYNYSLR